MKELHYSESGLWHPLKYINPRNNSEIEENGLTDFDPNNSQRKLWIFQYIRKETENILYTIENKSEFEAHDYCANSSQTILKARKLYVLIEIFAKATESKFYFDVNITDKNIDIQELKDKALCNEIKLMANKNDKRK